MPTARRRTLPANGLWKGLQVPRGVFLHLVDALQELRVGHELLHRADVYLAWAQAGGAGLVLDLLAMREILRLVIERLGGVVEHVADLLRVLAVVQIAVGIEQQALALERARHRPV